MINKWTATLSVNAGFALRTEGLCIWIDALHDDKVPDFSTLTPERQRLLFESEYFKDPDIIAFTHCHWDHYSEELCKKAISLYPDARLVLPEPRFPGQILIHGDEMILPFGNRLITFCRLTHEGDQFKDVPHYGVMIEDEGETILILGDCKIAGEDLLALVRKKHADTIIAPFPWITLRSAREIMINDLKPSQLIICHLPLPEDDLYGYVKAAKKASAMLPGIDVRLMTDAFQTEVL